MDKEIYIKITKNGPYLLYGIPKVFTRKLLCDENNAVTGYEESGFYEVSSEPAALCRCGKSKSAPFCDNSHSFINFDGTESGDFSSFRDTSTIYEGKNLTLFDNEKLCALARFCDTRGTIWKLIYTANKEDDIEAVKQANLCPSGRLMVFDKEGNPLAEELSKMVSVLEDEGYKISGPIFVSGGIKIESAGGKVYEILSRRTLCRCGGSNNKPFCDCTHFYIKFKALTIE